MKKYAKNIIAISLFYLLLAPSCCFTNVFGAALGFPLEIQNHVEPVKKYSLSGVKEGVDHFLPNKLKALLQRNKRVLFTFDDGPHPNATPKVLEVLKKHNIKAVFFVLGLQVAKHPELVKMIHDEGHIIGNHTYSHKYLSDLCEAEVRNEIRKTNDLIYSITGVKPILLRPPYGARNTMVNRVAEEEGMSMFLWTVDSRDWKSKNKNKILTTVESQLGIGKTNRVGGAVLLHDIYPSTANSLEGLIASINKSGLILINAQELNMSDDEIMYAKKEKAPKYFAPELSGNKVMVALLKPVKRELKTIEILRAHKNGSLMLLLALNK